LHQSDEFGNIIVGRQMFLIERPEGAFIEKVRPGSDCARVIGRRPFRNAAQNIARIEMS
jgi:hypothetical protein